MSQQTTSQQIHPTAVVDPKAELAAGVGNSAPEEVAAPTASSVASSSSSGGGGSAATTAP